MSEILSPVRQAQEVLAYSPQLFEVAKKKGIKRVDTLNDALTSVQAEKGVGRYEGRSIDHLQALREFAVPAVMEALRLLTSPDTRLSDLDTLAVLTKQFDEYERLGLTDIEESGAEELSADILEREAEEADELYNQAEIDFAFEVAELEDTTTDEELLAGTPDVDEAAIEEAWRQRESEEDVPLTEEEMAMADDEPLVLVDDDQAEVALNLVESPVGRVDITGLTVLEDTATNRTTIEMDLNLPAEFAGKSGILVTSRFRYYKRSGEYAEDGTSMTSSFSLNGETTRHYSTNLYFGNRSKYELILTFAAPGVAPIERVISSEDIKVPAVAVAA